MPGSRMLWTYSARPVTLSRPSVRGTERPIWEPALVVTAGVSVGAISTLRSHQGCAHSPLDVDSHQLPLVGGRTTHIGNEFDLRHSGLGSPPEKLVLDAVALQNRFSRYEPRRFLGRGAGNDAS